ncbi:MAG: hypothetical protein ACKOEE_08265, partial [Tagaea sp.]
EPEFAANGFPRAFGKALVAIGRKADGGQLVNWLMHPRLPHELGEKAYAVFFAAVARSNVTPIALDQLE